MGSCWLIRNKILTMEDIGLDSKKCSQTSKRVAYARPLVTYDFNLPLEDRTSLWEVYARDVEECVYTLP